MNFIDGDSIALEVVEVISGLRSEEVIKDPLVDPIKHILSYVTFSKGLCIPP